MNSFIQYGKVQKWDVTEFHCLTQSVERDVKLLSEASLKVCEPELRDGYIRTIL